MFPPKFLSILLALSVGVQIAQGMEDLFLNKFSKQSAWLGDSRRSVVSLSCNKQWEMLDNHVFLWQSKCIFLVLSTAGGKEQPVYTGFWRLEHLTSDAVGLCWCRCPDPEGSAREHPKYVRRGIIIKNL